jgi:Xaa-Pro aminopeptidase
MSKKIVQAKLITNKSNIQYLSNFDGSSGFMLITLSKKYLFTDSRYIQRAKNHIKKGVEVVDVTRVWRNKEELQKKWVNILNKHRISFMGIEEDSLTLDRFKKFKKISRGAKRRIKFINIAGEIESSREKKSQTEIKLITRSQRINEKVFEEIKNLIKTHQKSSSTKKLSEIELVWKIKELGYLHGADDISFDPIVAFGKNSAIPHHKPDKTILKKNDVVLIDMGMKYRGYCSDMSRTLLPQKPTAKQIKIYNIVLEAQKEGIKKIKAGISGAKADSYSRKIIADAGYAENYTHAGGHGIGLDIHESPSISENYTKKLKVDSVITVEPGIYIDGEFGVRIEDMILLTADRNKNLTKTPKEL